MRFWIVAIGLFTTSLSACNTLSTLQLTKKEQPAAPVHALATADIVTVTKPKTSAQKASQQKFLKTSSKRFKSKQMGAKYYVLQAQRNFNEQKLDSAKYLFGRAWLLDSTNTQILWGYGKVYGEQKEYDKALYAMYKSLDKNKNNPQLLSDIATTHLNRFYQNSDPNDLVKSKQLLQQAVKLNPKENKAYYKLAINSYYLKDYEQAWTYLHKSTGNKKVEPDKSFVLALLSKQKDPKGIYTRAKMQ